MDKIKEHYIKEAKEFGESKQSTIRDINIRDKEVEKIIEYLNILKTYFKNPKILEIGCGNGYTAEQIVKQLDVKLMCIDFCEDFIEIARKRNFYSLLKTNLRTFLLHIQVFRLKIMKISLAAIILVVWFYILR